MSFQPLTTQEVQELVELSDHAGPIKQLALSYEVLRSQYGAEISRSKHVQAVYRTAVEWRRHIRLLSGQPHTQKMIMAIEAAIDLEDKPPSGPYR